MTAKDVSVGLTYNVKFGDVMDPVTLTRECEWGGFYGRNERTGNTVRIATAGRLHGQVNGEEARDTARKQALADHIVTTYSKETTAMPTTTAATRNARSSRRAKPAAAPAPVETVTKPKPKAKPKAASKPATTPRAKPAAKAKPAAAKTLRISGNATAAAKPAANGKPFTVKLKIAEFTTNKVKFEYVGTAAEPFVKSIYITQAALEGQEAITASFVPYVQTGKKKPQTLSTIRYSGTSEAATDLYVNRAQAEAKGFTNDSNVKMAVKVLDEETVQLSISVA